jgi:hypothetical protein
MMRWGFAAGIGLSSALLAGCGLIEAQQNPVPNGMEGAPAALANAVEKGCMPYALGEKSEAAAMAEARLKRKRPILPSWPSPGMTQPQYSGQLPGNPVVTIYGPGCTVQARGDPAVFEAALDDIYRRRFGASYAAVTPPAQSFDGQFPGMKRFCTAQLVFESYPDPKGQPGDRGFHVRISPAPACATAR